MAGQAVDRRLPLVVAVHLEAHRVLDDTLDHFHLRNVAVARRTFHLRAESRVESAGSKNRQAPACKAATHTIRLTTKHR